MAGGLSFGSGFARGMAASMAASRAREERKKERLQDIQLKGALDAIERGEVEASDLEGMAQFIFGGEGKKRDKKQQAMTKTLSEVLGKTIAMQPPGANTMPSSGAAVSPSDTMQGASPLNKQFPQPSPLPSLVSGAAPAGANGLPAGPMPTTVGRPPSAPLDDSGGTQAALTGVAGDARAMTDPSGRGRRTMFGAPALSRDEAAIATAERTQTINATLAARAMPHIRKLAQTLQTGGVPQQEAMRVAMRRFGFDPDRMTGGLGATAPRFMGNVDGNQLPEGTTDSNGNPIKPEWRYRSIYNPLTQDISYMPTEDRLVNAGAQLNAAALQMGFKTPAEVPQERQDELRKLAESMANTRQYATTSGAKKAEFDAPIGIKDSQATGLPVGTAAPQVSGQAVPTMEQQASARTGAVIQADLQRLMGDGTAGNPGLLNVLPSKATMAGIAPGATLAFMRRNNAFREDVAALEAVVTGIVNDLARYKGQRGAQTEGDVDRVYSSLVALQAGLSDPFGGDTVESARRRITEAQAGVNRVAAAMPKMPVVRPTNTPAGAPSASPGGATGFKMDAQGNILGPDGKVLIPGGR